jgi:hypothetical protein
MRHVILQAAMAGAAIMLLLTIGLLFLGRVSNAAARPKPQPVPLIPPVPSAGPDPDARSSGTTSYTPEPPEVPALSEPTGEPVRADPPQPDDDDLTTHRHQVALGDDQIDVELAEARQAAVPCLRWAPLPYDVPEDGLAFACIGAGDEGCLFVDLAAAPGTVAITGDTDAAVRLAESIVHQLCTGAATEPVISVLLVGSFIPRPHPASAISVETLRDLAAASLDSPPDGTDIVFCELRSDDDASTLDRHVRNSRHRIVPVVLGHLPGAAWSFTASRNPLLDGELPSLDSNLTGTPSPSW